MKTSCLKKGDKHPVLFIVSWREKGATNHYWDAAFSFFWSYTLGMKKIKLGWREWVGIPEMGLPAIKAKIDTGAKTSSLHALDPEPCTIEGVPHVRFILMPVQRSLALGRDIVAPLVDRRNVKNSGGEGEERYVISLILALGNIEKEIEVTLANRRDMKFRMLLGRQALEGCLIDPAQSYLLGKTQEQKQFLRQLSKDLLW